MVIEDVYRTNRGNDCDALFWPGSKNCGIFCYEDQEDVSGFPINFLIEERVAASVLHEGYCTSPTHEIAALFQDNIPLDLGLERQ
jgi:hypothetical protein